MTQTNNPFLDELARLMTDAAGAAQGMQREFQTMMKAQGEKILRDIEAIYRRYTHERVPLTFWQRQLWLRLMRLRNRIGNGVVSKLLNGAIRFVQKGLGMCYGRDRVDAICYHYLMYGMG